MYTAGLSTSHSSDAQYAQNIQCGNLRTYNLTQEKCGYKKNVANFSLLHEK